MSDVESMTYHVYPIGDTRDHVVDGGECWCSPTLELSMKDGVGVAGFLLIHNSADGREAYETGKRKPQ